MSATVAVDAAETATIVHRLPMHVASTSEVAAGKVSYATHLKPALDFFLVLLVLPVVLPVMLLAMLLVILTSKGPALYQQIRIGRHGKRFTMYKIRSMYRDAEATTGPRWSLPGDPRITPVGWILRKTHIDELPQLWNVLRGELSLVGPRPERPEIAADIVKDLPDFLMRLDVRPGLSGLAQVQQAPDTSMDSVRTKLNYDLHYIENMGLLLDLRILFATFFYVAGVPAPVVGSVFRFPRQENESSPTDLTSIVPEFGTRQTLGAEACSRRRSRSNASKCRS